MSVETLSEEAIKEGVDCRLFGTDKECRGCSQRHPDQVMIRRGKNDRRN